MGKYRVFKSQYGEFIVDSVDENDDFAASFDGAKWVTGVAFDAYALQELRLVSDKIEASAIVDAAKQHLNQESVVALQR